MASYYRSSRTVSHTKTQFKNTKPSLIKINDENFPKLTCSSSSSSSLIRENSLLYINKLEDHSKSKIKPEEQQQTTQKMKNEKYIPDFSKLISNWNNYNERFIECYGEDIFYKFYTIRDFNSLEINPDEYGDIINLENNQEDDNNIV